MCRGQATCLARHYYNEATRTQVRRMSPKIKLRKVAEADFPTRSGHFRIFGFEGSFQSGESEEAVALKMGDLLEGPPPLVRIHSQCLTGDVFHSLRCDCRAQLEIALTSIARE